MNEEIEDDDPATDESRSRGPWYREPFGYSEGDLPPLDKSTTRQEMDRAADAALDLWLNRRGL